MHTCLLEMEGLIKYSGVTFLLLLYLLLGLVLVKYYKRKRHLLRR